MPIWDELKSRIPLAIAALAAGRTAGPQGVASLLRGRAMAEQQAAERAAQQQAAQRQGVLDASRLESEEVQRLAAMAGLQRGEEQSQRADETAYLQRMGQAEGAAEQAMSRTASMAPSLNEALVSGAQQLPGIEQRYGLQPGALGSMMAGMSGRRQTVVKKEAEELLARADKDAHATFRPSPSAQPRLFELLAAQGVGVATREQLQEIAGMGVVTPSQTRGTTVQPGSFGEFADPATTSERRAEIAALRKQYGQADDTGRQPSYQWATDSQGRERLMTGEEIRSSGARRPGVAYDEAMPSEYQTALDRAILSIPAIRRGNVVQTANRLWREGRADELKDTIRQAAVESEPVDVRNQVMGRMATLSALADTRAILEELAAKGIPTDWMTGTIEDLHRKLGTTQNPEYVALSNRLMGTLINYRRAATGVQFSARESADYQRMFPNYRNQPPVNLALLRGLEREIRTYDRTYWDHKLGQRGAALVGMGGAGGAAADDPAGIR